MASSIGSRPGEPRVPGLRCHGSDIVSRVRANVLGKPQCESNWESMPNIEALGQVGNLDGCQRKFQVIGPY